MRPSRPHAPSRRHLLRLAVAAPFLALGGCAWLDTQQRRLALRPTPSDGARPAGLRPGDVVFQRPAPDAPQEMVEMWWLPHDDPDAPALLYLHGTFRHLTQNLPKIDALRDAGFSILAVDYRGWGGSAPIVPSEATIVADARLAWREMQRLQPDPRRRVIYGHSLGGSVAVILASRLHFGHDYAALIVESTFTSLPDVAAAAGFWGSVGAALTTMQFDARSRIASVDAPILMLHGTLDHTVPIDLGRRLRDAAPPGVTWIEIEGGTHSRLHRQAPQTYRQAMRAVIDGLGPAAPATGTQASSAAGAPAAAQAGAH